MTETSIVLYIVIIAAIFLSEDKVLTLLAASIALNIMLLLSDNAIEGTSKAAATASDEVKSTVEQLSPDAIDDMYGPQYNAWYAHNRSYDMYPDVTPKVGVSCAENDYSVDALGTLMTQKRGARDKRAMDGAVSKGVDYYKYHYGSELDEEEAKPWWGRQEW